MIRTVTTRITDAPTLLEREGLDALVAVSPENVRYASGHFPVTASFIYDRLTAVVWPASGKAFFVCHEKEEPSARERTWVEDFFTYPEYLKSPVRALTEGLRARGLDQAKIAVEKEYLPAYYYDQLSEMLPRAMVVDGSSLLAELRSVKTPYEVELLQRAAHIGERAHFAAYAKLKPGDSELDVARLLSAELLLHGGDDISHVFVRTGRNGLTPQHQADTTPLMPGDAVHIDSGVLVDGYRSDLSRMAVIGPPTERHRAMWRKLYEVHRAGIERIRSGARAGDVFNDLAARAENRGIWFYGHGLGLFVHDTPLLTPSYDGENQAPLARSSGWELRPNMVVAVEFGMRDEEGGQRYQLEDMVLVTEDGPRVLSNLFDMSEMYRIG